MAETTEISWCDATFNPWIGCTKVAPGCTHCYAEAYATRYGKAKWGPNGTRAMTSANYWKQPHKWNEAAAYAEIDHIQETNLGKDLGPYHRPRVFCASLADVFEDWTGDIHDHKGNRLWVDRATGTDWQAESPEWSFTHHRPARLDDLRRKLFTLIDATQNLDWMLLTKRPENIRKMWPDECCCRATPLERHEAGCPKDKPWSRQNVWLGTTVTEQESADKNLPALYECRDLCPVNFISAEPLLGYVQLWRAFPCGYYCDESHGHIDHPFCAENSNFDPKRWLVIAGGESGIGARPAHPNHVRCLRDQCASMGVAFHFKQWGEWIPADQTNGAHFSVQGHDFGDGKLAYRVGKKAAGRLLDGRTWDEVPEVAHV